MLVADHEHLHAALDGWVTPDRYAPVGRLGVEVWCGGQYEWRSEFDSRSPDADVNLKSQF